MPDICIIYFNQIVMENKGREKLAQNKGPNNSDNFEKLFDEISDSLFLHDFEGNILKVNKSACVCLGYTSEELCSMNIRDLASAGLLDSLDDKLTSLLKNKRVSFEAIHITKNGVEIPVAITSKIIGLDNRSLILSSAVDITFRKRFEDELIESRNHAEEKEAELKAIFNNSPASIFVFDENMRILRVNRKGLTKFHIKDTLLENQRLGDIINCVNTKNNTLKCGSSKPCSTCKLYDVFTRTVDEGESFTKEEVQISFKKNKKIIEKTVLVSTSLLKRNGKAAFLATIDDISRRKKMERELIKAKEKAEESEKLKTAFLNNLSHEIRTPLNGILGFIDFFADENYNFSAGQKQEFIEIMNKSGERLINTVNNLVEISKLDSGIMKLNKEKFNFSKVLEVFILEQRHRFENPNIEFIYEIDPDLENEEISTDKLKLLQALKNLIDNAFKFTFEGQVKLIIKRDDKDIHISVEDNGIGIAPEHHTAIFEPFWQVENNMERVFEGNGLGLSIAKKLINSLGSALNVKSDNGKGSVFSFVLPGMLEMKKKVNGFDSAGYENVSPLAGKTILIAEDEVVNYLYLEAVLSKLNCNLIHAFNGKEAVDIVTQNPNINLVLMDLKMPVMDGYEATSKIKSIRNNIPVIAQSAYVSNGENEKAIEAGCSDYLSKPINKKLLFDLILKHIDMSVLEAVR